MLAICLSALSPRPCVVARLVCVRSWRLLRWSPLEALQAAYSRPQFAQTLSTCVFVVSKPRSSIKLVTDTCCHSPWILHPSSVSNVLAKLFTSKLPLLLHSLAAGKADTNAALDADSTLAFPVHVAAINDHCSPSLQLYWRPSIIALLLDYFTRLSVLWVCLVCSACSVVG